MKKNHLWKFTIATGVLCVLVMKAFADTQNVKVLVVDQDGVAVAGAKVDCDSHSVIRRNKGLKDTDLIQITDKNGIANIESRKRSLSERIYVSKEVYYSTNSAELFLSSIEDPVQEPIELTIKKIKNPIPMYSADLIFRQFKLPKYNGEKFGYDLIVGDWLTPHGKGKIADFIFHFEGVYSNKPYGSRAEYDSKIILSFSNEKDGIIAWKGLSEEGRLYGSDLVSDYKTPENGYLSIWQQRTWKEKGGDHQTTWDIDRNFYFRVRTKLDKDGNIISAHYGKIYGDFMSFIYYFNPTPNDRNVEFDTNKNLFKSETVDRP